jgi:hypothetical protein
MSFSVHGDYFEACTCAVSCPCIFLNPATEDACDLLFAWHIDEGEMDGVDLAGLNVALAVSSPKQMTDGGWKAHLYLDERADDTQRNALGAIFSGQAGGHLANVAPLIGEVTGVEPAAIRFERDGTSRRVAVGDVGEADVTEMVGMDGANPIVITNPLLGAIAQPVRQAKSNALRYDGAFSIRTEGRNGFIAEFAYAS